MKRLKTRDIPTPERPVAYRCYIETLGKYHCAKVAMMGLGEQFLQGKDYFFVTKYLFFYKEVLEAVKSSSNTKVKGFLSAYHLRQTKESINSVDMPQFLKNCFCSLAHIYNREFQETFREGANKRWKKTAA